jgi:uncharacterized protein (TIGR00369 family)
METLPPYARLLGLSARIEGGERIWTMKFDEQVVGRPGYLHGGAIAGLLEFAAFGALEDSVGGEAGVAPKPVNVTVTFLRGGIDRDTFAAATVARLGKRIANVEAHAWQESRERPIASAQMNLLLRRS